MQFIRNFYLAGGTALALQYGHRESVDFDFFTESPFESDDIIDQLSEKCKPKLNYKSKNTLGLWIEDVTCTFFLYKYPILEDFLLFDQIKLIRVADIAAMKIAAISGRGKKRDFIDLFFICRRNYPLQEVLKLYQKKYEILNHDLYHVYMSLMYFEDAERDAMPQMFVDTNWEEVKAFFKDQIKKLMEQS
jgi:predicted nucleotidyltransferase component of viral defense system